MITLRTIFDESTRLLQLFRARPKTKHGMKKVFEEALELNNALVDLDHHPQNTVLKLEAAKEACDVIVSTLNAYYARGGDMQHLEIAMESTFAKNRAKNEETHMWDGETVKKITDVAYIEKGQ